MKLGFEKMFGPFDNRARGRAALNPTGLDRPRNTADALC